MSTVASQEYLKNAVLTASREQLHLMLYDGAIRFALKGREAIEAGKVEESYNHLTRAQKIVIEMQNGLNFKVDPALCERMSALYTFVYRKLVDASVNKDVSAVDDALRILRHQRETWVLLMERIREEAQPVSFLDPAGKAPVRQPPSRTPPSCLPVDSSPPLASSLNIEG
jgi:flagellar secretion chaperone FliS